MDESPRSSTTGPPDLARQRLTRTRWTLRALIWFQVGMTALTGWAFRNESTAPFAVLAVAALGSLPCLLVVPPAIAILAWRAHFEPWRTLAIWLVNLALWWAYDRALLPAYL